MKFLALVVLFFGIQSQAQVKEPFGTICDPAQNESLYEVLKNWYNENRYDDEEVLKLDSVQELKEKITAERYVGKVDEGRDVWELYSFNIEMGEETVGVVLTVYAKAGKNRLCDSDTDRVVQYK